MCLSIAVNKPEVVLAKGQSYGHDWVVVHNEMGFRCGYVRVGKGHPWYGKHYDDVNVAVHGGLTFNEADVHCGNGGADDGWWFGFDCGHHNDAPDTSLPIDPKLKDINWGHGEVRTQAYVESECGKLCYQAYWEGGLTGVEWKPVPFAIQCHAIWTPKRRHKWMRRWKRQNPNLIWPHMRNPKR